ncbi:MAG TPA: flagellar basal body P-ring formation chaperone FlgA [Rhodospirillales bacterium]
MKKLLIALIVTVLLMPASVAAAGKSAVKAPPGEPVMLRESITVNSKVVRLGDLFVGVGDKADISVAYAPEPGKRAIFDANWLYRAAHAYKLNWRPLSLQDQVVVERESLMVTREEIEDHIRAALIERGADPAMQVELTNRMMRIYLPGTATSTIGVEDVAYESRSGRFAAVIAAPAGEPAATRVRVSGRVHKITQVPVPARRLAINDVITERDVKFVAIRDDRVPRDAVTNADELIGMAAKRGLRPGVPVQSTAVQQPILVPKGSLVTIVLQIPKMTLTAQGKALDNGSDGDTIRITNSQSKKVIEAEVTGPGKVVVRSADAVAIN